MKRKPNYLKHLLQWGVLAAIAGTVLWAKLSDKPVDVEAYCPFGGLQAFGTYVVNNSLACSMSMLQIMMGLVLAVGVILFSKLFADTSVRWAPSASGWGVPGKNCTCRSMSLRAASSTNCCAW